MAEERTDIPVTVDGKRTVVIGGTSGIGKAIAKGFAHDGADVIATSRTPEKVERTTAALREIGATTTAVTCDVRDRESLEKLHAAATDLYGETDVLVNSPLATANAPVTEMSEADWSRVIDVNLNGVYRATQVFGREMTPGAAVINISSTSAFEGRPDTAPYEASKGGVNAFTRAAAYDLAPDVRVNAIAPGFVQTPAAEGEFDAGTDTRAIIDRWTPMGRVGQPEDMIGAAIYLASDAAAYTTGEVLTVDGGYDRASII